MSVLLSAWLPGRHPKARPDRDGGKVATAQEEAHENNPLPKTREGKGKRETVEQLHTSPCVILKPPSQYLAKTFALSPVRHIPELPSTLPHPHQPPLSCPFLALFMLDPPPSLKQWSGLNAQSHRMTPNIPTLSLSLSLSLALFLSLVLVLISLFSGGVAWPARCWSRSRLRRAPQFAESTPLRSATLRRQELCTRPTLSPFCCLCFLLFFFFCWA